MTKKKLWQKGVHFDERVEAFTVGIDYELDDILLPYDCTASIVHAEMLKRIGILRDDECELLTAELERIIQLHREGQFVLTRADEDCHTAIENHLTERLGDLGKKIHTGRSRNDQVLTALRLYYKDELEAIDGFIGEIVTALDRLGKKYGAIVYPGYSHMRKAMPSSIALWSGAFIESMIDNRKLVRIAQVLVDQSPLGSGAGYGLPIELDRQFSANKLGFTRVQDNPIYCQLSRGKFEATILHAMSQILFDCNRLAYDLILFSMAEFGFFKLAPEICTGSSIMPQKNNPDLLELLRAKYHVLLSYEFQCKSLAANLPTGYHRDLQLTKEPVMKGFDLTRSCCSILVLALENLKVDETACAKGMTAEIHATSQVYELIKEGMPFRDAYLTVAEKLPKT